MNNELPWIVGCEESQAVTIALREIGIEAYSCDLKDCSGGHPEWHIKGDVFEAVGSRKWGGGIFFPDCTHLAVSGAKHFDEKRKDGRQQNGIDFFMRIVALDLPKKAIENPVGIMSTIYRKPDQIVQPYMFGDSATKTTCLWLFNLPLLKPTNVVDKGKRVVTKGGNSLPEWYNLPPGPERSTIRSKTFSGIAKAMAEQWSNYQPKQDLFS